MAELGPDAPRYHSQIGLEAEDVDVVLGVGELAKDYGPTEWVPTAVEAVDAALYLVRPGDAVLVKGSRSVGLEIVADALLGSDT
jgi:UDP-N-acetylmuramoyl-tripeptide--D-alanyl-D-alanine ligase